MKNCAAPRAARVKRTEDCDVRFTFHRPETVRQAAGLLGKNEDAKLLAGGQTLAADDEAAARQPAAIDRHVADRRACPASS